MKVKGSWSTEFSFSSLHSLSCPTLCSTVDCSMPGFPVHHQLPELTQIHVYWVGNAIQPSHPLPSLSPTFNLSQHQGLFRVVCSSHQVAEVLELHHQSFQWYSVISLNIPSSEYSGLISFRMDWLDLLAVQGTLRGLLQHHSSKAWILWCSAFFTSHIHTWLLEKP